MAATLVFILALYASYFAPPTPGSLGTRTLSAGQSTVVEWPDLGGVSLSLSSSPEPRGVETGNFTATGLVSWTAPSATTVSIFHWANGPPCDSASLPKIDEGNGTSGSLELPAYPLQWYVITSTQSATLTIGSTSVFPLILGFVVVVALPLAAVLIPKRLEDRADARDLAEMRRKAGRPPPAP